MTKTDAELIEEWLAAGNEIKVWGDQEIVVEQNGFRWVKTHQWPEWQCSKTCAFGRQKWHATHTRILPFVCADDCDEYGVIVRAGKTWCADHAEVSDDDE